MHNHISWLEPQIPFEAGGHKFRTDGPYQITRDEGVIELPIQQNDALLPVKLEFRVDTLACVLMRRKRIGDNVLRLQYKRDPI